MDRRGVFSGFFFRLYAFCRGRWLTFHLVLAMAVGLCGFPLSCPGSDELPETVELDQLAELYEPVMFDHVLHADMYDCSRCHHHTAGMATEDRFCVRCHENRADVADMRCSSCHPAALVPKDEPDEKGRYHIDVPSLKGAAHMLCRNCHLAESGPTACVDCHEYSEKGRKRFLVKD